MTTGHDLLLAAAGQAGVSLVEVGNSALFDDGNSEYLSRTPSGSTDQEGTFSVWVQRGDIGVSNKSTIITGYVDSSNYTRIHFRDSNTLQVYHQDGGIGIYNKITSRVFRDISAWYHIVVQFDLSNGTAEDRIKIYINGVRETSFSTNTNPSDTSKTHDFVNSSGSVNIGRFATSEYFDGYMSEVCYIDNSSLDATSFGEFDSTGLYWTPKSSAAIKALSFSGNSFYLPNTQAANIDESAVSSTAATISYTATALVDTNKTDYSGDFDGVAIGTANSTRRVFVNIDGPRATAGAKTISSCVIGGVSAALVARKTSPNGDAHEIWSAVVPSGTTADIDISASALLDGVKIGVWSVYDAASTFLTYTDSGTTLSVQADIPTNAVCLVGTRGLGYTNTFAGVTEDFDGTFNGGNASSAGGKTSTSGTPTTVSSTWSSTHSDHTMIVVVCLPADGPLNHFTNVNTVVTSVHTPTNVFCTWSPLIPSDLAFTLSEGNLKAVVSNDSAVRGTLPTATTGKYYFELTCVTDNTYGLVGMQHISGLDDKVTSGNVGDSGKDGYSWQDSTGAMKNNGTTAHTGNGWTAGDILGFYIDYDNDLIFVSKNGTLENSATQGEVEAGTSTNAIWSGTLASGGAIVPAVGCNGGTSMTFTLNAGQNTFNTALYSGYTGISTTNIAASTTRTAFDDHYQTELVSHDGSSTAFTCNWNADTYDTLFIIKNKDAVEKWYWVDGVRGYTKILSSDATTVEGTDANVIAVSGTTITLGSTLLSNNYLVTCHKGGLSASRGSQSESGSGDGALMATTYSANTTSGFSIVLVNGFNDTIANDQATKAPHGLSAIPDIMFGFNRDYAADHPVLTGTAIGGSGFSAGDSLLRLNTTAAKSGAYFVQKSTDSTNLELGNDDIVNKANDDFVYYCWHGVEDYSSFGTYEGSGGATTAPFIYTGTFAADTITKSCDSTSGWQLFSKLAPPYNPRGYFSLQNTAAYTAPAEPFDVFSTGFQSRVAYDPNVAETYVYMAWGGVPQIDPDGRLLGGR